VLQLLKFIVPWIECAWKYKVKGSCHYFQGLNDLKLDRGCLTWLNVSELHQMKVLSLHEQGCCITRCDGIIILLLSFFVFHNLGLYRPLTDGNSHFGDK
jgi:hypothetical protein